MSVPGLYEVPNLTLQTSAVSVLDQVSLATMAKAQTKDYILGLVIQYVHKREIPKGLAISKITCKAVQKYLLQFDSLIMKQGVLYWIYNTNDVESHQLVLPKEYWQAVLHMLHDDCGHQELDHTSALVRERFYWSTVYQDVTDYVTHCHQCHVARVITQVHIHSRGFLLSVIPRPVVY